MYPVAVLALQNLGEAEYVVALFMYMCLLGYPADKIDLTCCLTSSSAMIVSSKHGHHRLGEQGH